MRICSDKHRMNRRRLPFQYTDSEHTNPVLASVTPPHRPRLFVIARGGPDKKGVKTGRNMCAVCLILPNWQDYADNWLSSQPLSRVRQSQLLNMIEAKSSEQLAVQCDISEFGTFRSTEDKWSNCIEATWVVYEYFHHLFWYLTSI